MAYRRDNFRPFFGEDRALSAQFCGYGSSGLLVRASNTVRLNKFASRSANVSAVYHRPPQIGSSRVAAKSFASVYNLCEFRLNGGKGTPPAIETYEMSQTTSG